MPDKPMNPEQSRDEAAARIAAAIAGDKSVQLDVERILEYAGLLAPLEYEQVRKPLKTLLGLSLSVLDAEVKKRRPRSPANAFDAAAASVDEVRKLVESLLDSDPNEEDKKRAETAIWEWLRAHARVFCCYGIGYLLLNDGDGVPLEVSQDDQNFNRLLIGLGVHPGSPTRLRIGKFIGTKCYHEGIHTETRLAFHYDPDRFTAYAARDRGVLIKVDRWGLEEVPNGTDGQLFVFPETWQPLLSKPLGEIGGVLGTESDFPKSDMCKRALFPDGHIARHLFKDVHFDIRGLGEKQIRVLLMAYLLFLMLPGAVSERALLECLGPSGSGKTFFAVLIGLVLFGRDFDSQALPSDLKEFENQVINAYYIVYDNVSHVPRDIRDRICQSVTGMDVVRRILYTDKGELRVPSRATIALSAINPPLPEFEHQNRSVVAHFKERSAKTYISGLELRKKVLSSRDDIVLNLLRRMTLVIRALEKQRDYVPKVAVRLASVATFILRVARHEGWEQDAERLLEAWSVDQVAESLDDDDVSTAIARWMTRPVWEPGKWFTATKLNENLVAAMIGGDESESPVLKQQRAKNLSWEGNALKLAKQLGSNLAVYDARFGLKRNRNVFRSSRGTWAYCFEPADKQRQAAAQLARGEADRQLELSGETE